jgi:hypothetical protein
MAEEAHRQGGRLRAQRARYQKLKVSEYPIRGMSISSKIARRVAWRGTAIKELSKYLVVIFALLLGCASSSQKFDIKLLNASHSMEFNNATNNTIDTISFVMQNNEDFALDCDVKLELSNTTNASSKQGRVGELLPGQQKNVSLHFAMFDGKTSLSIKPDCVRV